MSDFTNGLRSLAEFYDARPDFPEPCVPSLTILLDTKAELLDCAKQLGNAKKNGSGSYFYLTRNFGSVTLDVYVSRETVCTRHVVGQQEVTRPVQTSETETVIEDIVEWECLPLLRALDE